MRRNVRSLVVLIGSLALTSFANAQTRGVFVRVGDMTAARAGHSAALLLDGTVLIAGGDGQALLGGGVPAGRRAELYDPATGKFAATGSMIEARFGHGAVLLPDGRVLIAGGTEDASAELYDPGTHRFSRTGSMTAAQHWVMATALRNGKVLVAGNDHAELYDPTTETFSRTARYATPYSGTSITLLADGRVLFVGDEPAQLYDPDTDMFSATGYLAAAGLPGVDQQTATLLNDGRVLIAGGSNDEVGPAGRVAAAELYDPAAGKFTATSAMHAPRSSPSAALLPDGRVLIAGGDTGRFGADGVSYFAGSLASAEIYDPASGTFTDAASMNVARTFAQATPLANGDVLITGGYSYCGIGCFYGSLSSAEIYHSAAKRRAVRPR